MRAEMIDNLVKIKNMIPEYIELLKRVDEEKNANLFIIEGCDVRTMAIRIEHHLESSKINKEP